MRSVGNADAGVVHGELMVAAAPISAAASGVAEEHGAGMNVELADYREDMYTCII